MNNDISTHIHASTGFKQLVWRVLAVASIVDHSSGLRCDPDLSLVALKQAINFQVRSQTSVASLLSVFNLTICFRLAGQIS